MLPGLAGFQSKAMRDTFGTTPLSSSIFLPTRSGAIIDSPVMFPPGRPRLATSPLATGSSTSPMTMGIVLVACWAARIAGTPPSYNDVHLQPDQIGGEGGEPIIVVLRPSGLHRDVLAFDPAQLAEALLKSQENAPPCKGWRKISDHGYPGRLLRLGRERRSQNAPTHHSDERSPVHHSWFTEYPSPICRMGTR